MHLYSKILTVALLNTFLTGQLLGQATGVKGFFEKRKNLKKERIETGLPFLSPHGFTAWVGRIRNYI